MVRQGVKVGQTSVSYSTILSWRGGCSGARTNATVHDHRLRNF